MGVRCFRLVVLLENARFAACRVSACAARCRRNAHRAHIVDMILSLTVSTRCLQCIQSTLTKSNAILLSSHVWRRCSSEDDRRLGIPEGLRKRFLSFRIYHYPVTDHSLVTLDYTMSVASTVRPLACLKQALRQCRAERQQQRRNYATAEAMYPSLQTRYPLPSPGFRTSQTTNQNRAYGRRLHM